MLPVTTVQSISEAAIVEAALLKIFAINIPSL
jgi:hypothetical protein